VELVDHRALPRRSGVKVSRPIEEVTHHDRFGNARCAVCRRRRALAGSEPW
jgi:hypothetical protein